MRTLVVGDGGAISSVRYSDEYREMHEDEEGSEITTERKTEKEEKEHYNGTMRRMQEGRTDECQS